jgi:hypothetical protein
MRTKIKDIKVINKDKLLYILYKYSNRIFELQIEAKTSMYRRHLKGKEAVVAFLTDVDTKNYLAFKKAVESISWETIDKLFDEKVNEIEFNNGKQLTLWK